MDPRKQECFGLYLYGAGYFARDENTLSIVVSGRERRTEPKNFCMMCPRHASCEKTHNARVRNDAPALAAEYERLMQQAQRRGASAMLAKLMIAREGRDPFQEQAIANFNKGHADRGQLSGLIVHSDADPRRR